MVDYFAAVDGMHLNDTDREGFLFLPLQEVKPIRETYAELANFAGADSYFIFADYLAGCWWYAVRLCSDRSSENTVIGVGWEKPKLMARSFTEFVELYFTDHPRLYGGDEEAAEFEEAKL